MLIDCTHCHARVDAEILEAVEYIDEIPFESYRIALLRCPQCQHLLVGSQDPSAYDERDCPVEWSLASRVWPEPGSDRVAMSIPASIRIGLLEAYKCFNAGAYTACVAMSGRAIEAMCRHFSTKKETLFDGLKELHERQIIDARLYQWGDELRKHRNLAAHASDVQFALNDAKDLYDFATAICDYVFVLTEKFEAFKKRQAKTEAAKAGQPS
jgi:hypothetical protein